MAEQSSSVQPGGLVFPANLAVGKIGDLKQLLCEALRSSNDITLDPTPIRTADTASLQLLAAFVNRAKMLDRAVSWSGFSEVLTTAATLLGLRQHLGLQAGEGQS